MAEPVLIRCIRTPSIQINSEFQKITFAATYDDRVTCEVEIFYRWNRSGYLSVLGKDETSSIKFLDFVTEKRSAEVYLLDEKDGIEEWSSFSLYHLSRNGGS